jgi:hypothetical protein
MVLMALHRNFHLSPHTRFSVRATAGFQPMRCCVKHVKPKRKWHRGLEMNSLVLASSLGCGTPGRARTCDLRLRRPTLYPTELRAHKREEQTNQVTTDLGLYRIAPSQASAIQKGLRHIHKASRK